MEPPFHMAVNLSARQLARPEIVDEVRDILPETGLRALHADPRDHRERDDAGHGARRSNGCSS